MGISTGDSVTIAYTGRLDDGTVFDTSREAVAEESGLADEHPGVEYEPLVVEIGDGRIIEGLEEALHGLEEGDAETVTVPPEKAYGDPTDEKVVEYESSVFRQMLQGDDPEEGMYVQSQEGEVGEVVHVDAETVRVDFNHQLAGKTLTFDIEVLDIE